MSTLTKEEVLKFVRKSKKKDEALKRKIEFSIKRAEWIMYWTTPSQKKESDHKTANLSDQILNLIRPVCKKVAKVIHLISHTNDQNLPKPKIP